MLSFFKNNWKFITFNCVLCIVLIEVGSYIYLDKFLQKSTDRKFQFDSYKIYGHVPGYKETKNNRELITINNQGFRRSKDVEKIKPKKCYRIFLMGGSAAHCISSSSPYPIDHVYQNETIDYYLEELLNKGQDTLKFEVINAAVTGYQVHQHTSYLLSEIIDYNPDLVIFLDGVNDHFNNNVEFDLYQDNVYQFWKDKLQKPSFGSVCNITILWLSEYSSFFKGLYAWKQNNEAYENFKLKSNVIDFANEKELVSQYLYTSRNQYLKCINTNLLLLNDLRIKSLVCLQPWLAIRDSALLSTNEKEFLKYNIDKHQNLLYRSVLQDIDSISLKHNSISLDFVPVFNDEKFTEKQLFIDYCHYSRNGTMVIANNLFSQIILSQQHFFRKN